MKLVLVGGGGHCQSVLDTIKRVGDYESIVITDKNMPAGETTCGCVVVGGDDHLVGLFRDGYKNAVITVGSIKQTTVRRKLFEEVKSQGFALPTIIDPSAVVSDSAEISEGVFVGKNSTINSGCWIGVCAIINTGAIVEHNCRLGDFSHVAVGAVICGDCEIGDDVLVGANATVIQGIRIGNNSIIGAGSVILADVPDNKTVYGLWRG